MAAFRRFPRYYWARGLLVLAFLPLLGATCSNRLGVELPLIGPGPDDEAQIEAVLEDVQRGLHTRRIYKVLAHVSRSYKDEAGRDYAGIEQYLNDLFKNYREIRVTRARPQLFISGDRARVVETFGTRAEPFDSSNYPPIDLHGQVNVYLERSDAGWKIIEWGRVM